MGDTKIKGGTSVSPKSKDPSIAKLESKLRTKYSSKVELHHNESNGKGKIVLHYASLDQMERILEVMGVK
jgi:ParB family chromosome partitioning protein